MQCPNCKSKVRFSDMARHRCPRCASKIYFMDKWRWLRGISCGLLALLVIAGLYRFHPFDKTLVWFLACCVVWLAIYFALLLTSIYLLPPAVDLVPQDGPIRLDL